MAIGADAARYIRVASITLAAYEYLITLPDEYRIYSRQESLRKPSLACVLFFLIRYSSVAVIVVSNVAAFGTFFTDSMCEHFYLASPLCKVLQTMISQAVLGVRTYAISKHAPWVKWLLIAAFTSVSILEAWSNIYGRVPLSVDGQCSSGNLPGRVVAFVHYLVSMFYDLLTLSISWLYLFKQNSEARKLSGLWKILFLDGLGYFIVLTGVNFLNLIIYKTAPTSLQTAAAPLAYSIILIMTQRILINLQNFAHKSSSHIPHHSTQSKQLQSQHHPVGRPRNTWADRDFGVARGHAGAVPMGENSDGQVELAVRVHVNKTSHVDVDGDGASGVSKSGESLYLHDMDRDEKNNAL